jgi:hypothetical protein
MSTGDTHRWRIKNHLCATCRCPWTLVPITGINLQISDLTPWTLTLDHTQIMSNLWGSFLTHLVHTYLPCPTSNVQFIILFFLFLWFLRVLLIKKLEIEKTTTFKTDMVLVFLISTFFINKISQVINMQDTKTQ